MSVERSPARSSPRSVQHQLLQDTFRTEGFFPQSVNDSPAFPEESNTECVERYPAEAFDCVDGRLGNERRRYAGDGVESCRSGHSTSSDEGGKGFKIEQPQQQGRCLRFKDGSEPRFGSSCESERKYHPSSSSSDRSSDDCCPGRTKSSYAKVKGASKQKQLEDDELDADTRVYGKSPKFDENLSGYGLGHLRGEAGAFDCRSLNRGRAKIISGGGDMLTHERRYYDGSADDDDVSFNESGAAARARRNDGVVFNTLDGFENESASEPYCREDAYEPARMNLDVNLDNCREAVIYARDDDVADDPRACRSRSEQDYLRKNDERKFSAGQIKRPLSQDEDVSSKSGRVLESPEVTPGDVGRMLNLGNALDGPRQTQANKYLSLVTLHLPVILRLSVNCPFQNVRIKCAEILEMVKVSKNYSVGIFQSVRLCRVSVLRGIRNLHWLVIRNHFISTKLIFYLIYKINILFNSTLPYPFYTNYSFNFPSA